MFRNVLCIVLQLLPTSISRTSVLFFSKLKHHLVLCPQPLATTVLLALSMTIVGRASEVKASAYNLGDLGPIPGWGWSPGEGKGNPLSRQKYWSELPCPPPGVFCIGRQYLTTKPRGKQIFITASKTSTNWKSDRKINLALSMGKCGLLLWKRRLY